MLQICAETLGAEHPGTFGDIAQLLRIFIYQQELVVPLPQNEQKGTGAKISGYAHRAEKSRGDISPSRAAGRIDRAQ